MNYWINSIIPYNGRFKGPFKGIFNGIFNRQSRRRANRDAANSLMMGIMGIGGLGLGAGLMFMLDPVRGRRRRALTRDQIAHAARLLKRATGMTSRDLSHRTQGLLAEGSHFFRREEVSDDALAARVRARIGRSVSHPHAISVTVDHGHVTLSGPVLAHEARRLLSGVLSAHGVKDVENALTVYKETEGLSSLQGGRPRTGDRFALMQTNWSPTARLFAGLTGGALMSNCLARRDPISIALGTVGFGLFMRSATNLDMKSLLGVGRDRRPIKVRKTINIHAPVEEVFDFWTDYRNFPHFMANVREVWPAGHGRSHWIVAGPAGLPIEWTSQITELVRNKLLSWKSVPDSAISHSGVIRFEPIHEGSTRVHIELCYYPPAGAIGHALARVFGSDPKSEMDTDLIRMKTFIETGHPPRDAAIPMPRGRVTTRSRARLSQAPFGQQSHLAGGP